MALTQNEQLIIKYIGQNFLTKESMQNVIPCQTLPNREEYSKDWLSKDGTSPLIPVQGAFYLVTNIGYIMQWDVTTRKYVYANMPEQLTKEEVAQLW